MKASRRAWPLLAGPRSWQSPRFSVEEVQVALKGGLDWFGFGFVRVPGSRGQMGAPPNHRFGSKPPIRGKLKKRGV